MRSVWGWITSETLQQAPVKANLGDIDLEIWMALRMEGLR